ncbi:hypothetical protein E1262_26185 [Jiangella aurantiaca]|uniref:D-glucuronyl C5-epimerase C-terminal domain-containing protein n=1 Tax=Jiangella aurantiaca TaxID=2530373 RepID=A0A4R5A2U2_9ACTN|nr:hypothetical protein [Jiangella aurantiaca]TDD65146.1 hypothetical protein E1262_26185 [Jiangella aurantiaca]
MRRPRIGWTAALAATLLTTGTLVAAAAPAAPKADPAEPQAGAVGPLANTAHLDFLLDQASPAPVEGHTTYRLAEEPALTFPWTYADARPGGTFERIGGGPLDPETGHYSQGAYNADDVSRAAVVYLRHWRQTGSEASREKAYELLRSLAYLQTSSGPNAGNVLLWIQADGTLNPSAEPVELPDPSDSGPSYWLARTIWAFGEGYAAFAGDDPEFAAFLRDRLHLAVDAVDRQVLDRYGEYAVADGLRVPAWLIVDGADATAEAVLGLSAYVTAAPSDVAAREALRKLAEGVAAMGGGDPAGWPYGAILPWAQSRSMWHAWGSQMPASLAAASSVLGRPDLVQPAVTDSARFVPVLLTAGGADNGWLPTPTERVQIAYGVDSRLQSLLAVGAAADRPAFDELAALTASWYFGANPAGEPMYDPATGVTFDGVNADGVINRNSGAESTIHGQLSMLALDANPSVRDRATALTTVAARDGLRLVEAEAATSTTGTVRAPESAWTGESLWSGSLLSLAAGQTATFDLGPSDGARRVEPVSWLPLAGSAVSVWTADGRALAELRHRVGDQGLTAVPGALLPQLLPRPVPSGASAVSVEVKRGTVDLDALLIRPEVSRLTLTGGDGARAELLHSAATTPRRVTVTGPGTVRVYDATGSLVGSRAVTEPTTVTLRPGGFAVVTTG